MRTFEYADRIEYIKAPQSIPAADDARVRDTVASIMREVAARGDTALRDYSRQFDGVEVEHLRVSDEEIDAARQACDDELIEGARFAIAENGGGFHGFEEAAACVTILGRQ